MALQHGVARPRSWPTCSPWWCWRRWTTRSSSRCSPCWPRPSRACWSWDDQDLAAPRALVAGAVFVNLYWWTKPWWASAGGCPSCIRSARRRPRRWRWRGRAGVAAHRAVLRRGACCCRWPVVRFRALSSSWSRPTRLLDCWPPRTRAGWGRWAASSRTPARTRLSALLGWGSSALLLALAMLWPGWWSVPRTRTVVATVLVLAVGGSWATWRERQLRSTPSAAARRRLAQRAAGDQRRDARRPSAATATSATPRRRAPTSR